MHREKEGKFIGYHISGTILDISNILIMYFLSTDKREPQEIQSNLWGDLQSDSF